MNGVIRRSMCRFTCCLLTATCLVTGAGVSLWAQASGSFGSSVKVASFTNVAAARMNATHNVIVTDQTSSTRFPFDAELLTGSSYAGNQVTALTITNFQGDSIDDAGALTYCYYNSGEIRINTRIWNGGTSYTPTYNIYVNGSTSAACIGDGKGTVYYTAGDGSLQTAEPDGSTFTMTTVSGAPSGISGVALGNNGNLLLSATGGTYVGTVSSGVWTGALVTTRKFYRFAAYQDSTGNIYLEDASAQAGYQYSPGSTYTEASWTKPFGVTAVAYSYNSAGSLMVASATAVNIQYSSSLLFPKVAVGTADPVEELVFKFTAGGTLGSVTIAGPGGAADFVDAGTGTCTTNGSTHTYAVGDLCTVDVTFNPIRGGARTGTVTLKDASNSLITTAALTGTGIGGTVDHLSFTTVPTATTPGASFAVVATAYSDVDGKNVATFVNGTAATVTSSDSAATLPTNATFVNGVASFNATLNTPGSKTITAGDPVDSLTVTSSAITVGAAVNHLALIGLPASATAGTAISGTVTAYSDAGTTVATSYTGPVKITSSDTNASLPSNLMLVNGTGNFNVTLKTTPSATVTAANTGGTPSVTSSSITVNAAAASAIYAAIGSGQSTIIGTAFTNALVVQTVDAYTNPVGGVLVNLVIPTNGAGLQGGTYQCTTSATVVPAGSCSIPVTANATVGSYTVSAQSGSLTAASFSLTNSAKTAQAITFNNPGTQNYGTAPTLSASSNSSLIVSFSSSTTAVCTVTNGGALTFVTSGTCTIAADQAGNSTYAAASTVSRSFSVRAVVPGAPTIGTATGASQQATVSFTVPANTGGSAITGYTVTSSPDGITATGTGSPITVTGLTNGRAYTFTVTAANSAGPGYASSVSNSITPSGAQTITFANPGAQSFGTMPTLSASTTSSLAVSFTSSTTSVCTVTAGGALTFLSAGTCTINADQAGNTTYTAANTVTQSFTVQAETQTITFTQPTTPVTFGVSPITLSASGGTSGSPVTFSIVSGPGSISGNKLTVSGAGTIVVAADQAGNSNFAAATQVQRSIVVNVAAPTVAWSTPTAITYGQPLTSTQLNATATGVGSATVAGSFSYSPAAGAIVGAGPQTLNVTFTPSDPNYSAATQQVALTVNKASATLTAPSALTVVSVGGSGIINATIAGQYTGSGISVPGGSVSFSVNELSQSSSVTIASSAASWPVPVLSAQIGHIYTVAISYAGDANYNAATATSAQFQVGQIMPTIVWSSVSPITYGATAASLLNAQAMDGSKTVNGTYVYSIGASAISASSILPAGSYTLTVAFTPNDTTTYKPVSGTSSVTVNKVTPSVALTSSVNPSLVQNATVLTASVASTVSAPTGTVTFLDGATSLGTSTLASGVATLSVSTLAVGTHSITAVYLGDNNFLTLTSGAVSQTVNDFSLNISISTGSSSVTSQTVLPGGTAVYTFTVSPAGTATFPATVALSASGLPAGATYTLSPTSIAAGSGATTVTLTVKLASQTAAVTKPGFSKGLASIALGLLLLPFSRRLRKSAKKLPSLMTLLLVLIIGGAGLAGLTGCGASTGFFASAPQTYTISVTGTSGALVHSTNVTLTVQ